MVLELDYFQIFWGREQDIHIHSALFKGLRMSIFWTRKFGIANWPKWSPRPDFDGFDQFHHWILQKSQGEAGQGGAIWRSPDVSNEPEKKI